MPSASELLHLLNGFNTLHVSLVGFVRSRKLSRRHVGAVFFDGAADQLRAIHVLTQKFWFETLVESEQVVEDQNLAVAPDPGADADGRNLQAGGDLGRE